MKQKRISLLYLPVLMNGMLGVTHIALAIPSKSAGSDKKLEKVLEHYWAIEQSLANDSLSGVIEKAELMIPAARSLNDKKLSNDLRNEAKNLASSAGGASGHAYIDNARDGFKALSTTLAAYLTSHPQKDWEVFHCPMASADWIQKKDAEVGNPFYGKDMASCGEPTKARE